MYIYNYYSCRRDTARAINCYASKLNCFHFDVTDLNQYGNEDLRPQIVFSFDQHSGPFLVHKRRK